jgi:dUTP pyrophosphatase
VPSNLIIRIPQGYSLLVALRSSAPRKKCLLMPHGVGLIDQDYRGPDDEVGIQLYNFSDTTVTVSRGERIAQFMIVPIGLCELVEVEATEAASRGGFGSTG